MSEREPRRVAPPWLPTSLVAVLLILLVLMAPSVGPWDIAPRDIDLPPEPEPDVTYILPQATPTPPIPEDAAGYELPPIVTQILVGILILAVAVMATWLVILLLRYRKARKPDDDLDGIRADGDISVEDQIPILTKVARRAWLDVAEAGDPTDAIIRAWLALEDAASRSGMPRRTADTPTDVTVRVLERTEADPDATQALLRLYHRARFGTTPMTAADQDAAVDSLKILAGSWDKISP